MDDEFLQNLYRGGELLAAGKVIEAKDYLERAFKLQPKNEKGQNLLGLTYFKLGLFDRAAEIYETLVRENPVDATLRVNLGLVYLKTNQLQRAIREFETSVDLAPEHQKAHNYLGLALAQLGNYAEAKEHFVQAGSDAMAQKMERAMSGEATGLHRLPAPLEQQQRQGFAEIEGSEVVAERGGQQVVEDRRAALSVAPMGGDEQEQLHVATEEDVPPEQQEEEVEEEQPSHEDWGSHFGESAGDGGLAGAVQAEAGNVVEAEVEEVAVEEPLQPEHSPEPELEVSRREPIPPPDEDLRFAEDEGPGSDTLGATSSTEAPEVTAESETVMSPEDLAPATAMPSEEPVEEPAHEAELESPPAEQWAAKPLAEVEQVEARTGQPLADFAPSLEVLKGAVVAPFEVRPEGAAITVHGEVLSRVDGLVLATGAVKFDSELKRFRGRTTDQAFGESGGRMMRATGRGVLVIAAGEKRRFECVELSDESAYFREEVVYAFEEAVMFENGRIPSEVTGDLDLVHLRGKGKVLLRLGGPLRAHQVRMDEPATVPLEKLAGWFGNVSPRLLALATDESGAVVKGGAELSGEGFVLFTV